MLNLDSYTEAICARLAVEQLKVFGSSSRDDFDSATSDIDFFYWFEGTENIFKRFWNGPQRRLGTLVWETSGFAQRGSDPKSIYQSANRYVAEENTLWSPPTYSPASKTRSRIPIGLRGAISRIS